MKKLSKLIAAVLMFMMIGTGVSMNASAASGQIVFGDPETAVGEKVEVVVKIISEAYLGDAEVNLTYDPEYLRLIVDEEAAPEITGGEGQINIKSNVKAADDEASSETEEVMDTEEQKTEYDYTLNFYALKEGSTLIEISGITVYDADKVEMEMTEGNSSITIAEGDPSKIPAEEESVKKEDLPKVHFEDKDYTIAEFSDVEIPDGFVKTSISYEGQDCDCIKQENSGMHAFFLEAADGTKSIFLYDGDTGLFTPMHMLGTASDNYIILLRDNNNEISIDVPYQETTITIGGDAFPAWQNPADGEYYLVYALNKDGKKTIYRYDSVEKTYQRFAIDTEGGEEYQTELPETAADDFVQNNWKIFAVAGIALILLLLIMLLVVRIKLARRDRELDDLYDEYGIDLEEEEEAPSKSEKKKAEKEAKKAAKKEAKAAKKAKKAEKVEEDLDEEEFEEELDEETFEEYEEDDSEEDFDEEDFEEEDDDEYYEDDEDDEDDEEEEDFPTETLPVIEEPEVRTPVRTKNLSLDDTISLSFEEEDDINLDDDSIIDDLDQLLDIKPAKKRGHIDDDDTFKVDFIDLD